VRFASYDGTQLAYTSLGDGPPLVCLPGGPGRAVAYLEDLGGLTGRTLVLLDPRATGHSEVPADPATLRYDRLGLDLEALREHLGLDQLDLLAHSAGTIVGQAWASQHPATVGSLTLVTPSDRLQGGRGGDVPTIRETFRNELWYAEAAEAAAEMADAPVSQQAMLERATRPFFYGRWDARTQEHAATADRQSSKRALLGFAGDADKEALVAGLRNVTAPVLVVGGERDGMTGVTGLQLVADSFPNASVVVIPGAGHFPWIDEPAGFVSAVAGHLGIL
jgi:pimeloyl-ACP methyl ester carboxylesterase